MEVQFFIPPLGTEFVLANDWDFALHREYRNIKFGEAFAPDFHLSSKRDSIEVTLPAGTKLIVDRIYVRKGVSGYDSVTFRVENKSLFKGKHRFWVKLADANKIVATKPCVREKD